MRSERRENKKPPEDMGNMHARRLRPGRYVVGRAADLVDGGRVLTDIDGRSIGVFHIEGKFYALLNRCPHQGGELCRGNIVRAIEADKPGEYHFVEGKHYIVCPWHGWEFDVATGQSFFDPARTRVRAYAVETACGDVIARHGATFGYGRSQGPYRAETFQVEVDDEYLVVVVRQDATP